MNILVTCCLGDFMDGTIELIKKAYPDSRIVGIDMRDAIIMNKSIDKFYKVGSCYDDCYIDDVLKICKSENIDVVVPIHTAEIDVFWSNIDKFNDLSTVVAIAKGNVYAANHKDVLYDEMRKNGIKVPLFKVCDNANDAANFLSEHSDKKFVVKEKYGCGGRGFYVVDQLKDISHEIIVQEFLPGNEYTVDCLCKDGEILAVCAKHNTEMENGVALYAEVIHDDEVTDDCIKICKMLGLTGSIGFDLKKNSNGEVFVIDCNPRLTATISLSCKTGVNFVEGLIELSLGKNYDCSGYDSNCNAKIYRKKVDYFYE